MSAEVLLSVQIGPARLEVLAPRRRMSYYKPRHEEGDERPVAGVFARIIMDARFERIASLRDLIGWAERRGIDLRSTIQSNPNDFARFVSFVDIKHYVRVVEMPALYPSVERDFDVELHLELPRVIEDELVFIAGRTTFTSQKMWRIRANIFTGLVEESEIPRR